jgi:hypothetical protein
MAVWPNTYSTKQITKAIPWVRLIQKEVIGIVHNWPNTYSTSTKQITKVIPWVRLIQKEAIGIVHNSIATVSRLIWRCQSISRKLIKSSNSTTLNIYILLPPRGLLFKQRISMLNNLGKEKGKVLAVPLEFLKTSYLLRSCTPMLSYQPERWISINNI